MPTATQLLSVFGADQPSVLGLRQPISFRFASRLHGAPGYEQRKGRTDSAEFRGNQLDRISHGIDRIYILIIDLDIELVFEGNDDVHEPC